MLFQPNFKRKKGYNKWLVTPFPYVECNKKYEGIFTGMSVEVFAYEDIIAIYDNGYYGKGTQSRSTPQVFFNAGSPKAKNEVVESLSLGLEEAFFLAYYINVLKIKNLENIELEYQTFLQNCLKVNDFFIETLASYLYLKSRGWVIKSGLTFGGNYLIYRKGPRFYHASFVVIICTTAETQQLDSKNLKGLQRIAETSDKDVLILELHTPIDFRFSSLYAISKVEISEIVIRRFNCASYVQNQNTAN